MVKYVKRSLALASVATSFLLGGPLTEIALWLITKMWSLYGAYIRLWLEQHAAFFVVLCFLCVAVVAIHAIILLPSGVGLQSSERFDHDSGITRLTVNGMFMAVNKPVTNQTDATPSPEEIHSTSDRAPKPKHTVFSPLKSQLHLFQNLVSIHSLLPKLHEDDVITYDDMELVNSKPTRNYQIMCLVNTIEQKGQAGIKGLIRSIEGEKEHLGHRELAEELRNGYSNLFTEKTEEESTQERPNQQDSIQGQLRETNMPKLQLDTVMDMDYSFENTEDARRMEEWGLKIISTRTAESVLFVAACLAGNFQLPPYYELVSSVYYFWSNEKIPDKFQFDMQHCVDAKTAKQTQCLSFASANTSCGPPFHFTLLEGGKFNPKCTRGVVSVKPQGLLAIVKRKLGRLTLRTEPQVLYDAQVFYTRDTPMEYECTAHFAITPSTKAWQQAVKKHFKELDALPGHKIVVTFVKDSLTVSIPDGGHLIDGWKITCITSKVISREDIAGHITDRLTIPECQFSIKWVGREAGEGGSNISDLLPSDLHHNVTFTGSHQKKSESFFHLHARSTLGEELKGFYGWDFDERKTSCHGNRHNLRATATT